MKRTLLAVSLGFWLIAAPVLAQTETPAPPPATSAPSPHATEPSPDATEPSPDAAEPSPDSVEPSPDAVEPSLDTAEPSPDAAEPSPHATEGSPAHEASPAPHGSETPGSPPAPHSDNSAHHVGHAGDHHHKPVYALPQENVWRDESNMMWFYTAIATIGCLLFGNMAYWSLNMSPSAKEHHGEHHH